MGLSKEYFIIFFPAVSNGERVGKLSVVVEGTFMLMHDSLLPHNTAGCVWHCKIAKLCNTCSLHTRFAQYDRMLGAVILHQVLLETWGTQAERIRKIQQAFFNDDTDF
jgi:hypothetical protein